MEQIIVAYPNGTYRLNVDAGQYHIYMRVRVVDGYRAANHLARLWVGARRTKRAETRQVRESLPVAVSSRTEAFCWNRACYSCGNHSCSQRNCEER